MSNNLKVYLKLCKVKFRNTIFGFISYLVNKKETQ